MLQDINHICARVWHILSRSDSIKNKSQNYVTIESTCDNGLLAASAAAPAAPAAGSAQAAGVSNINFNSLSPTELESLIAALPPMSVDVPGYGNLDVSKVRSILYSKFGFYDFWLFSSRTCAYFDDRDLKTNCPNSAPSITRRTCPTRRSDPRSAQGGSGSGKYCPLLLTNM